MKKQYESPELNMKTYAQFENVFATCGKTPSKKAPDICEEVAGDPLPKGSTFSNSAGNIGGSH